MTSSILTKTLSTALLGATCVTLSIAEDVQALTLTEGFDDISTLSAAGWVQKNNSNPLGERGWFQGNPDVFPAQSGAPDSYIGTNFENTGNVGTISNWLLTPELNFQNGSSVSFFTRTIANSPFPDRLEVRLSTAGSSSNVGTTADSVGDFTTTLLPINPTLTPGGYPEDWTQYTLNLTGLSAPTNGRLAFRYFVTDAGLDGTNSNYVGIDSFSYTSDATAIPTPALLPGLIAMGVGVWRRKRQAT